jgi:hypothetical protein
LRFHLNRPSRRARYVLRHAYTGCRHPRTHPAAACAAWRPSPHIAPEPEPHPGAFPGAAAGPAGRAVASPHSATAALSNSPGIEAGTPSGALARPRRKIAPWPAAGDAQPNDPAAWGYAARSPMTGKIWRTTPPSRAATSAAGPPFQRANHQTNSFETALNLFHSVQTKSCLGHCITRGIGLRRQATILRLRGAVLFGARGNGAGELEGAPGVEALAGGFLPGRGAARCLFVSTWTTELCDSAPVMPPAMQRNGRFP